MKVAVIGTGYVGLVAGACLAETGNDVICADVDAAKIDGLRQNRLPIHEPGLESLVVRNQRDGRLQFTTDVGTQCTLPSLGKPGTPDAGIRFWSKSGT